MSKVTEELDFMWEKRVLDYYEDLVKAAAFETNFLMPCTQRMDTVRVVLNLMGLHVKGIEN